MAFSPLIKQLIEALQCLPGIGPKSAQRMALHLLERDRKGAERIVASLATALSEVGHCRSCRTLTELDYCSICADPKREKNILCVVESPADMLAIEQAGGYRGQYFILQGHLSPIDGIGPEEIGVDDLLAQLQQRAVEEMILATNPTVEGEATAHFIAQQAIALGVKVTRIAHGVPVGGELEYVDGGTLLHAFAGRKQMGLGE